jgi:hypothetical protein
VRRFGKIAFVTACLFAATIAQSKSADPVEGIWNFQSLNFAKKLEYTSTDAGTAIIKHSGGSTYDIRMVANELDTKTADGHSWATLAVERCVGQKQDAQFKISCQIVRVGTPEYTADNFVLQIDGDGTMTGTMNSHRVVTFTRVD